MPRLRVEPDEEGRVILNGVEKPENSRRRDAGPFFLKGKEVEYEEYRQDWISRKKIWKKELKKANAEWNANMTASQSKPSGLSSDAAKAHYNTTTSQSSQNRASIKKKLPSHSQEEAVRRFLVAHAERNAVPEIASTVSPSAPARSPVSTRAPEHTTAMQRSTSPKEPPQPPKRHSGGKTIVKTEGAESDETPAQQPNIPLSEQDYFPAPAMKDDTTAVEAVKHNQDYTSIPTDVELAAATLASLQNSKDPIDLRYQET